jgi:tyrosyl-tRNA synthetase
MTQEEWDSLSNAARWELIGQGNGYYTSLLRDALEKKQSESQPPATEDGIPRVEFGPNQLAAVVVFANLAASRNEARRLIEGGGLYIDGVAATNPAAWVDRDVTLRRGKHGRTGMVRCVVIRSVTVSLVE